MIRTLIVDDEPLARRAIRAPLDLQPDVEVIGEAGHGAAAIAAIEALRPDLIFLDVQMPEMTGFDVIETIGVDAMPLIVFVTAFDAYALRAFEAEAFDYLLKPFDDLRFGRVLDRVRRQLAAKDAHGDRLRSMLRTLGEAPKLVVRSHGSVRLVRLDEIDWIAAAGDYAEVHCNGRALLLGESMAALERSLPQEAFARIHRSAIVRLDRVAEIRSGAHGDGVLRLACGTELRFSRRYRQAIDAYLGR
ncbi:response regulator [Sphingomonas sp. ABOLE]|uniref:LytR/AlgR family response regulator transcription factor n=1 Tax=Sphingomonas sp. ABOLE TaxID=1985878 RepID=UPI000F7E8DE4|nr:response regulator [Sphingomonas sp. ABOLE]RSV33983.1 response regulator [Sphingomonas sp. ABOLE]